MPALNRVVNTVTFRFALIYLGLFLVSVLAILGLIYWFTVGFIDRQTTETIAAEIAGLNEQYRQRGLGGLIDVVNNRSVAPGIGTIYLLASPNYRPLAGNLVDWPDAAVGHDGWVSFEIDDEEPHSDPRPAQAITFTLPGGYHLLVGHDLRDRRAFERQIEFSLAWSLVATLALGIAGGMLMSRHMLRRIETINRTADKIITGALQERVPRSGNQDELDQLAANLNRMLDQIEMLMTGMRQITESIAHDLRTPLTRLRTRLELASIQAREEGEDPDSYRQALQEAITDADRLLGIFTAILSIAEAEASSPDAGFRPVSLAELALSLAELYEPAAEERRIAFATDIRTDAPVLGNDQLLSQAAANLLDNALKYTPENGTVRLIVSGGEDGAGPSLTVSDTGPGIPADQRDNVLRRFVRLDQARTSPGNGLGLSLVDAVVRRHGGRLELADNEPGLRITMIFPAIPGAARPTPTKALPAPAA